MKEQAIQKINKIGKISSVIALIGKIMVGIALPIMLIVTILCFAAPESLMRFSMDTEVGIDVDLESIGVAIPTEDFDLVQEKISDEVTIEAEANGYEEEFALADVAVTEDSAHIQGTVEGFTFTLRTVAWLLVTVTVTLAMTMVTICFISSLCKAFRDCQSPFESNVIKKMQNFAFSLIPWAVISTLMESVGESFMSNRPSVNITVDLGIIVIVLIVFVLVHIFKYGAVLQQESDETL